MSNFSVEKRNDDLLVDSRIIAEKLGLDDYYLWALLRDYKTRIESAFGTIAFKREESSEGKILLFAWLTKKQTTFLLVLLKANKELESCPNQLLEGFDKNEDVIDEIFAAQEQEIKRLRLEHQCLEEQVEKVSERKRFYLVWVLFLAIFIFLSYFTPDWVIEVWKNNTSESCLGYLCGAARSITNYPISLNYRHDIFAGFVFLNLAVVFGLIRAMFSTYQKLTCGDPIVVFTFHIAFLFLFLSNQIIDVLFSHVG